MQQDTKLIEDRVLVLLIFISLSTAPNTQQVLILWFERSPKSVAILLHTAVVAALRQQGEHFAPSKEKPILNLWGADGWIYL